MAEPTPVPPILETARLRLRPLAAEDVTGLHALYGDAETMRFWDMIPSRDESVTAERIAWSRQASPEWHATWSVCLKDTGQFIGAVNYHNRAPGQRRLAVGWILARPYWKQGYMAESVPPMLDHCFGALESHRIEALIEPENVASIALAERLGFRWEGGLLRDRLLVGGQFRNVRMYALLEDEWHALGAKKP